MPMVDREIENREVAMMAYALSSVSLGAPATERVARTEKRLRFLFSNKKKRELGEASDGLWSRTDLKKKYADIFKQLEDVGPQLIVNAKESGKERVVLFLESEVDAILETLRELSRPRYATGQDIYRDLAHDSPPSEISTAPRKKVFQNRRSLTQALSAGR